MAQPERDKAAPVAVIVLRAWLEDDAPEALRVRVTQTLDITTQEERLSVVTSPDEVYAIVQDWLQRFLASN